MCGKKGRKGEFEVTEECNGSNGYKVGRGPNMSARLALAISYLMYRFPPGAAHFKVSFRQISDFDKQELAHDYILCSAY